MSDAVAATSLCINAANQFNTVYASLKSVSDRIAADSYLSSQMADAAKKMNRPDLTEADFDNLKVCIDLLTDLLNALNGENVPVVVNTGGAVKLGFYKMI
jgi:hypothetical protein